MSYKRSKYFTTSDKTKIKYLFINNYSQICVIFLHGFMSDMIGAKPMEVEKFCKKEKINFLKFEYSGHGRSKGKFIDGNISRWTKEAKQLINKKIKKNNKLILVGSSMGSWIALNLFSSFKKNIRGFLGISSAPDFLEELMWKKFDRKIKKIIKTKKIYNVNHGNFTYPISNQILIDGRKNRVLNKKINTKLSVTLLHGNKDDVVPIKFSKKILKIFTKAKKKLIIIKNGDHRLSKKRNLKKICKELSLLTSF